MTAKDRLDPIGREGRHPVTVWVRDGALEQAREQEAAREAICGAGLHVFTGSIASLVPGMRQVHVSCLLLQHAEGNHLVRLPNGRLLAVPR